MILITNTAACHGSHDFDAHSIKITAAQVVAFLAKADPGTVSYYYEHGYADWVEACLAQQTSPHNCINIRGTVVENFDPFDEAFKKGLGSFTLIQPELDTISPSDHYRLTIYYPSTRPQWRVAGKDARHFTTLGRAFQAFISGDDTVQLTAMINTNTGVDFHNVFDAASPPEATIEALNDEQDERVGDLIDLHTETTAEENVSALLASLDDDAKMALHEKLQELSLRTLNQLDEKVEKDTQSSFRLPFASKS